MNAILVIAVLAAIGWLYWKAINVSTPDNPRWLKVVCLALCLVVPLIGLVWLLSALYIWWKRRATVRAAGSTP